MLRSFCCFRSLKYKLPLKTHREFKVLFIITHPSTPFKLYQSKVPKIFYNAVSLDNKQLMFDWCEMVSPFAGHLI